MKSFEEREKALENDIERVGGQTIQKMRQAVKAAVSRHSGIQKEISATKVKLRAAKKRLFRATRKAGNSAKASRTRNRRFLAAKTQFELIEKEAATVLASFELAQKAQKEREKEVEAAEAAFLAAKEGGGGSARENERVGGKRDGVGGKADGVAESPGNLAVETGGSSRAHVGEHAGIRGSERVSNGG